MRQSVRHIHCGLVRNESLNIRIRRLKKRKEIFRVRVGVRYGNVCLTGREWQIRPTGSLSLHLRADNAGLSISVHELHQFSGSIVEINVSFPPLCLSNTALSYLCVSLSLFLWFSSSSWHARWDVYKNLVFCLPIHFKASYVGFTCKGCSNTMLPY